MRKSIFIFLFILAVIADNNAQRPNDLRISGIGEVSHFANGSLSSYGILTEFFINNSFSLNYQYTFGTNQFGHFYAHYPGTVSWIVNYLEYFGDATNTFNESDAWMIILAGTFGIPEGISFHTYPREWLEIAPFINPFSADYNILDNQHSTITASIGIRAHVKLTHNLSLVPHFGLKHIYKNAQTGNFYGFGIGWLF